MRAFCAYAPRSPTTSRLQIVCKTSRSSWKHCYFKGGHLTMWAINICPLTILFFKALLNIIGGKGAISIIKKYQLSLRGACMSQKEKAAGYESGQKRSFCPCTSRAERFVQHWFKVFDTFCVSDFLMLPGFCYSVLAALKMTHISKV